MELLIPFALKSLLIAGVTLGLLRACRNRSSSERSWIAHFGLLALVLVPVGSLLMPQLVVQTPAALSPVPVATVASTAPVISAPTTAQPATIESAAASFDWAPLLYGVPVLLLLAVTALALLRLFALRARATVLVEPTWLSALAHAQRRMGFKHGTALLTSNDLHSPISWGVLRPVILLNESALEAQNEAEAIIAHELAHVRGLDWVKLLLARVAVALYWFNPLVWMLSREAHQLREEAADDAVLQANIADTDYAQLLVGVARHECKGMLLGAHGVAPSRNSLARRVRRVLDSSLPRGPVAGGFAAGVAVGAIGIAAPLAALTVSPKAAEVDTSRPYYVSSPALADTLPGVVATAVSQATTTGVAAALGDEETLERMAEERARDAEIAAEKARLLADRAHYAADAAQRHVHDSSEEIDRAIAWKAIGVTPEYAARMRAAAPYLDIEDDDLPGLKAVGVTPDYVAELSRAGYRAEDADELAGARAVGLKADYIRELASVGYRNIPLDELTGMRAVGVDANYILELRRAGHTRLDPDKLIKLRALGHVDRIRAARPPRPPQTPIPPDEDPDEDPDPSP